MLLQFTCSKTSGVPLDMCPTVAATHSSSTLSSVSLLSGFVVGSSLSAIFQPAVVCACVDDVPVSPDVPLLGNSSVLYADLSLAHMEVMLFLLIDADVEICHVCKSDVWLTVHRNSVWVRKSN